jgi:carbamoyl-phosphate synthase large subunit
MRSTGEVLGMAGSFGESYYKALEAASQMLPMSGTVLITVSTLDRPTVIDVARMFEKLGFKILATNGTNRLLNENGIKSDSILKLHEGRPNILDAITNKEINLIINTPIGKLSTYDDSYIRKAAIKHKIPYITTLAAAVAAAKGIEACRKERGAVKSIQEYHRDIK